MTRVAIILAIASGVVIGFLLAWVVIPLLRQRGAQHPKRLTQALYVSVAVIAFAIGFATASGDGGRRTIEGSYCAALTAFTAYATFAYGLLAAARRRRPRPPTN